MTTADTITINRIRTEADHEAAVQRMIELSQNGLKKRSGEWDEFHVIAALVTEWEKSLYEELPESNPVDIILFFMEQNGLKRKDMAPYFGGLSRVSEVLNRKRELTIPMIKKLHAGLHIPLELLIK